MQSFEEETEHLLRVMLRETLKLAGSPSYDLFDIPRGYIFGFTCVEFLDQLRVALSESATCTQRVLFVDMILIEVKEEEFDKWLCIAKALKNTVHKASVAQVLEASAPIVPILHSR